VGVNGQGSLVLATLQRVFVGLAQWMPVEPLNRLRVDSGYVTRLLCPGVSSGLLYTTCTGCTIFPLKSKQTSYNGYCLNPSCISF
jgi:hypothetical protein